MQVANPARRGGPIESQHSQGWDYGKFKLQRAGPRDPQSQTGVLVSVAPSVRLCMPWHVPQQPRQTAMESLGSGL